MPRSRLVVFAALSVGLLAASLLGGASIVGDPSRSRSTPTFRSPIEWNNDNGIQTGDNSVAFTSKSKARLADFPTGRTIRSKSGTCFRSTSATTYTGPATWSVADGYDVRVKFAGSVIPLESGHSLVGQQDWSELKIIDCKGNEVQVWGLICGNAGKGSEYASEPLCDLK
jgi:hypothetical protein